VKSLQVVAVGAILPLGQSLTVTLKLQLLRLPQASVAVQVTVVVPAGKQKPEGGSQTTVGFGSQMSEAVALKFTTAQHGLVEVGSNGTGKLGQLIEGARVSTTFTVWLQEALLPLQSVAVQVRVTLNSCGQFPGVVTSLNVTVGFGSQASLALGGGKTGDPGHSTGEGATGQLIVGGRLSITFTVWLHSAKLPEQSVARQVRVML
jgi:hypothetical protein